MFCYSTSSFRVKDFSKSGYWLVLPATTQVGYSIDRIGSVIYMHTAPYLTTPIILDLILFWPKVRAGVIIVLGRNKGFGFFLPPLKYPQRLYRMFSMNMFSYQLTYSLLNILFGFLPCIRVGYYIFTFIKILCFF